MRRFVIVILTSAIIAMAVFGLPKLDISFEEEIELYPPSNMSAVSEDGVMHLKWDPSDGANAYYIYRKGRNDPSFRYINVSLEPEYSDDSCTPGKRYTYKIYPAVTDGEKYMRGETYLVFGEITL